MVDSIPRSTSHMPSHRIETNRYRPTGYGRGVIGYVLVSAVFFVVLIVVFTALSDSIGAGLQELIDQLPLSI